MSVFIAQLLEQSLESPSEVSGIHERVIDLVKQMETGEVVELVSVLKKGQEDLNEQMSFTYFKQVKELEEENKELKKELAEVKETNFQRGFDAGREEYQVDTECLEEKDKEIEKLKEEKEILQKANESYVDLMVGESGLIDKNKKLYAKIQKFKQILVEE